MIFSIRTYMLTCCMIIWMMLTTSDGMSQDTLPVRMLTENDFLNIVRAYHPVARQAELIVDRANAEWIAAKAGFDPVAGLNAERKTYDGKNYFDYVNPSLSIPAWYGIELSAGLEERLGELINPELTRGRASYLTFSVPVARDLVIDKRRAVLRKASLYRGQSRTERALIRNDLFYEALGDYWKWAQAYVNYGILSEIVSVNESRLRLVQESYRQGDRPALDTTEALAQLQSFQISRDQAWLEFRKASFELSNHLWQANDSPWYIPPHIKPDTIWMQKAIANDALPVLDEILSRALTAHPKLQGFDFKLQALEIEKKLRFQEILPQVDLKYSLLGKGYAFPKADVIPFFQNNYKFGIDASMPIFIFKGRGEYKAARIEIQNTDLQRMNTRLAISNKVKYHFNELAILKEQSARAEAYQTSNLRLFRGEETRFRIGEGSLFMLNTRENKLLEARQKLAETKAKYFMSRNALQWAAGQLQ